MKMQSYDVTGLLLQLLRSAQTKAASFDLGKPSIIVGPVTLVAAVQATDAGRYSTPADSVNNEYRVAMLGEIPLVGIVVDPDHPYWNTVTIWADDVVPPMAGNPLLEAAPAPDFATHPFEHAMWGVQMDEWISRIGPAIFLAMSSDKKPLVRATYEYHV